MAKKWNEVVTSPEYQGLDETKRWETKNQYFDQVVTPEVLKTHSDTELSAVRGTFFNTNYNKFDPADIGIGVGEKLKRSWGTGQDVVGLGMTKGIELFEGRTSPDLAKYVKDTKDKMAREQVVPKNFFETLALSATQLTPLAIEAYKRAMKGGAVGATGFMGITALAGAFIPFPEELITVPAAGIVGFTVGAASEGARFMMYVEGGLALDELQEAGVEDNIARPIATIVGGVNAVWEMTQALTILKTIPGLKGLGGKGLRLSAVTIAKNPLLRKLALRAAAYLGFGLTETAQEILQEGTTIIGIELGKKINNELNKTNLPAATKAEIADRLVETAKGSAGLWLLGLPGTSASVVSDIVQRNKQAQADVAVIASEGIKEVEKAEEGVPGTIVEGLEIDATDIGQEAIKAKAEGKSVEEFVKANEDKFSGAVIQTKGDLKEIGFSEEIFNQAVEKGANADDLIKLIQSTVGENKDVGVFTMTGVKNITELVKAKRTLILGKTKAQLTDIYNKAGVGKVEAVETFTQKLQKIEQDFKTVKAKTKAEGKSVEEFVAGHGEPVYHGSSSKFDEFSYKNMGKQGTSEGYGFYFTNKKSIAKGYYEKGGSLKEVYVDIKKPLSLTKKEITKPQLSKFIDEFDKSERAMFDDEGGGYLDNWGDISHEGRKSVLEKAVDAEFNGSDNDVDMISGIINASGGAPQDAYPVLKEVLGYDGIIEKNPSWGKGQTIKVAFSPDQIKTKAQLTDIYNKAKVEKPAEVVKEEVVPEGILREEVTELSNEELVHIKQSLAQVEEKDEVTSLSLERIQKEIDDRKIDETQYMSVEELAGKIGLKKPALKAGKFVGKINFGAQQRKLARELLRQATVMNEEYKQFKSDILDEGGVKAFEGGHEAEEFDVVPRDLLGNTPLDELAEQLNEKGYNFEDGENLRAAIGAMKIVKGLKVSDFMDDAKTMLEGELGGIMKAELLKTKPSKKLLNFVIEQSRIKEKLRRDRVRAEKRRAALIKSVKHRLKTTGLKWGYQDKVKALAVGLQIKKLSGKQRQSLENFAKFIKEQQDEGIEVYANAKQLSDLGKKDLHEMTEIELRELDNTIKSTIHQGRLKNKLLRSEEKRTIEDFATNIEKQILSKEDIEKPKDVKLGKLEPDGFIDKAKSLPRELTRTERFLEHIAMGRDSDIYKQVWLPINDTFNEYTVNSQKKYQELGVFFEGGRKNSKLIANEVVPVMPVGINKKIELSPNNYKMAYIYSLTAKGRQHLMEGNNLTAKDLKNIEKNLTDQDRKDIKMALDMMDKYYPELNKMHNKIYGVDLPKLPSYFHFFTSEIMAGQAEAETMSDMLSQPAYVQESMEKGFLKERKGGTSPLVLDFWGNISRSIDMFEKYKAMALAERDVRRLIKHEKVKNAIIEKSGDRYYKDLLSWFGDSIQEQRLEDKGSIEKIFKHLRLKSPISLLYGNAMIPIRQTGSLALGLSEVGLQATPYLMEYANHPIQTDKVIYAKDPVQQYRRVERDIAEMISQYKATHIKALAGKEGMFEWGIKPVMYLDKRTSNSVWWMAYKTSLAKNAKKITDADMLEAKAIQYAQYAVRKTQPAWTKKDLPRLFRRQSEISKMVTMFSNYPNQIYNYVAEDTLRAYKKGTITRAEMATHLWWSLGVGSLLYGFSRRWRLPSLKEMLIDTILYPLGLFPLLRGFSSALESKLAGKYTSGFHFSTPAFIFFDSVYRAISAGTLPTAVKYGTKAAAFYYGIPYTGPDRMYKGIRDMLKGETGDWRRLFVSEWALGREKPSTTRRRVTRGSTTRKATR